MNKFLERLARRFVPSTSLLSHNFLFKCLVNSSDLPAKMIWKEFRKLPPNHLRIRVGVGNRFFSNQSFYLDVAESFWLYYMSTGAVSLNSTVVDIGCGCGRFSHHLRDFRYLDTRFTGQYIGVDIDPEMLHWCREHFDPSHFQFLHSTNASRSYKQSGASDESYTIPIADQSVDFVFSRSFSHIFSSLR